MQVLINAGDVSTSPAVLDHARSQVDKALRAFGDQITRVEVHLRNDSQLRSTPNDKRCTIEARPAGRKPLAVSFKSDDLYEAVTGAASRLERAVKHMVDRRRDVRGH